MDQIWIILIAVLGGGILGWLANTLFTLPLKRKFNSVTGYLESEKLMKEKFQKENHALHQINASKESELKAQIKKLEMLVQQMDEDLLLLQMDNEKTEALMKSSQPEIYALKTKLIEANNTISRYKSMIQAK